MASHRVFGRFRGALMATAKPTTNTAKAPPLGSASPAAKAGASTGIRKPVPVSPVLSKFVGAPEVSRTDAVKKVWEYIKLHNLQNPANKKEIRCDEKLKTIFDGKDTVGFVEIARLLSQHFPKSG